jgi:hypothetical protein
VRIRLACRVGLVAVAVTTCSNQTPPSRGGPCPRPRGSHEPEAYFEFQVATPARIPTGFPRYQQAALPGEVLLQVVVDPCGFPDLTTFRILKSDRPELSNRARAIVGSLRFVPAELSDGQPVPQLVQEVMEFR